MENIFVSWDRIWQTNLLFQDNFGAAEFRKKHVVANFNADRHSLTILIENKFLFS